MQIISTRCRTFEYTVTAQGPCAVDMGWGIGALADTLDVLVEMTERLEQRGERVHLMPFGWHKECHTEAVVGPGARQIIRLAGDGDVPVHPRFRGIRPLSDRRRHGRCVTG
ncbi:hypothetical protein [Nocardia sp. NPDC047648]|uniref:hypothetical protein n=1 Tax=Nocardia sp. NPDC047648 TaxID=3155625 RepID=UPI0033FA16E2